MIKFKIKQITGVFTWNYLNTIDRCAICRNSLNDPSIEFQANIKMYTTYRFFNIHGIYFVCFGKCGHSFHLDCIERWLFENQKCPLCARIWIYENIIKFNLLKTK